MDCHIAATNVDEKNSANAIFIARLCSGLIRGFSSAGDGNDGGDSNRCEPGNSVANEHGVDATPKSIKLVC